MATVDPAVPNMQAEQFLNYSKPIPNISPDTSMAQTISTIGGAVEGAVTLADSTVKQSIKNDIYKKVDPLRDAYTASLEAINNGTPTDPAAQPNASSKVMGGPQIAQSTYGYTPQSAGAPQSLIPENSPAPVPPALQSGLDKVSVMAEAAKQNGHYNDTQYTGQLTALTKQLRSQYPGYRPFIDEQVSAASGVPIANAYVKNLIEDANRQAAGNKSEQEKMLAFIRSKTNITGADEVYASYLQNGDSNAVMRWATANESKIQNLQNLKLVQEVSTGNDKTDLDNTTKYVTATVGENATKFFYNKQFATGDKTPAQIADAITYTHLHPESADEVAITKLGGQYQAYRAQYINETMAVLNKPGTDGKSPMQKLGPKATMDLVNQGADAMFGATSQMIYDKDFGVAHLNQSLTSATVNNASMKILGDPGIGARTANIAAITKLAPQTAPVIFKNIAQDGYDSDIGAFTTAQKLKGLSQPDMLRDGRVYTFADTQKELKSYRGNVGPTGNSEYKTMKAATDAIIQSKPKEVDLKLNGFNYLFDPKNLDNMTGFKEGYFDPSTRRFVQGREAAFNMATSPDMTANAYSMKNQGHPEVWDNYKNYALHEAANHLIPNNVSDLNDAESSGHFHFSWDTDNHRIAILNADGRPLTGMQASVMNLPRRATDNINRVLHNLQTIAEADGTNVDAYLFNTLNSSVPGGASSKIMTALRTAHGAPAEAPLAPVYNRYAPEDKGPSVQDFVANPTGQSTTVSKPASGTIKGNLSDQPIDAPVRVNR